MNVSYRQRFTLQLLFVGFLIIYFGREETFFWDTIQLASKHAHWYFENNFQYLFLPMEIDSGHPPVFGAILALCWMLFGKSLVVSHFFMLPWVWGGIYQIVDLSNYWIKDKLFVFLTFLVIADPVLFAHWNLISPDTVLICCFLLGLRGVLYDKFWWKMLAMLGLAMISTRGMMTVVALYFFDVLRPYFDDKFIIPSFGILWKKALPFIPSGIFAIVFLAGHYQGTGWIGYHEASPWAWHFQKVGLSGLPKNMAIVLWRMMDFGRVFLFLIIFVGLLRWWNKKMSWSAPLKQLLLLIAVLAAFLLPTFLIYIGLNSHRYMLPLLISISFFTGVLIHKVFERKKWWYIFGIVALISGNLWIYPDKIAQAWDNSIAFKPYIDLRKQMHDYISKEGLELSQIGTAFPEVGPLKYKDLSDTEDGFVHKDMAKQQFVLYSNVMNDYSDEEIDELSKNWKVRHELKRMGVKLVLYEK